MEQCRRFLHDWEAAVHERDIAAIDRLLAADFELVSPVAHKPYTDRRMCLAILQAVLRTLPDLAYTRREAFPGGTLLVFRGTVDGLTLEGVDLFDLDADGRARRLTVLVRPLKAATAFAQRMGAELSSGS